MSEPRPYQRLRALGVRLNKRLATARDFNEVKRATLIGYGATLFVSVLMLSLPLMQKLPRFALGDVATGDLKAQMDLRIADDNETERLKKAAFERERPAFDRDFEAFEKSLKQLQTEFTWIARTATEAAQMSVAERRELILGRMPFLADSLYRSEDIDGLFREKQIQQIESRALTLAEKAFQENGFLTQTLETKILAEVIEKGAQIRTINAPRDAPDVVWSAEQLQTKETAVRLILRNNQLKDAALSPGTMRVILTRIRQLQREIPSLVYNPQYTLLRRNQAAEKITPVYKSVKRGSTLLRAGDLITEENLRLLEQVRENHRRRNGSQIIGIFLIMGVLAVSLSYFTFRFAYEQVRDYGSHFILHGLFWVIFAIGLVIMKLNPLRVYDISFILFVPFGFFGILTGQFFGARIALSAGIYLSIFFYILTGFDNQSLMLALTSAIAGLYASTRMQKRTQMFKGGVIIAITNLIIITGFELLAPAARNYELKFAAIVTNSILSILLTLGLLPLIEMVFNLPTPFRLMELNDFNHPLLTRMAAIAPSTHSHSVMLANLSEAAVRALGGDTLLTRVGCLFHDIGKMAHPDFYAENRHLYPTSEAFKKLGPVKSAHMITRHVTDGIAMARENRLPEKIISFIPEHHGTTTIQYFYHKALEQAKPGTPPVSRKSFQYPGPRPQTRETAVVMIADSVEAASRTAASATKEEFAEIIDRIIQNKISEEQFHEAPLTLGELALVRKAFLDVLVSTYHERPHYPTMQETRALENQAAKKSSSLREVSVQTDAEKRSVSKKAAQKPRRSKSALPRLID
ncbi:HD family phosphohydrolase [Turneriella parva]|uniref:7TM receptor with intracellular metal dependent phosphohydrolase n=1 Tax=Turneriella parva (strain ATCC BAA-1111 / DSM 21527 / NCTC 11395 / H) TaxID=869212 RepID=I4B610_TURPD|nr:HDIG domain-containing metalloprotein [Turneriella parva]AFM12717.1 7TM receptor with intracellular metal dependent phosphohydrolase [Turneriella parva DSM 21527]